MKFVKANMRRQKEIMKAFHEEFSLPLESRILANHFGRGQKGATVGMRWYFLHIFKYDAEVIKYCDVYLYMNTYKLQKSYET